MEEQVKGNSPEKKFRAGAITSTVWKNTGKTADGKDYTFYSFGVQRAYKDKQDNWQNTTNFRANDIARIELVISQTKEYLLQVAGKEEQEEGQ